MAQKVQVVLEDDLDGGTADETVLFGLDGTSYEIDLNKKNAAELRGRPGPLGVAFGTPYGRFARGAHADGGPGLEGLSGRRRAGVGPGPTGTRLSEARADLPRRSRAAYSAAH